MLRCANTGQGKYDKTSRGLQLASYIPEFIDSLKLYYIYDAETMKIVLSFKEANREHVRKNGNTLLHEAAGRDCVEMIEVLLEDPHLSKCLGSKNKEGYTPLRTAMTTYNSNARVVKVNSQIA